MKYAVFVFFLLSFLVMGCGHKHRHKVVVDNGPILIRVGDQVTGYIDGAGDADWYAVELEGGKEYKFCTSNLSADMDTVLRLVDVDGVVILSENDNVDESSLASCIEFCVDISGTYFLVVTHKDPNAVTGMYDLSVELLGDCLPDVCNGNGHYTSEGEGHDGRHCSSEEE